MKPAVLAEVQRFVLRSNVSEAAQVSMPAASQNPPSTPIPHLLPSSATWPLRSYGATADRCGRGARLPYGQCAYVLGLLRQYYACVFLNQMILLRSEAQIAHTLILIYLSLFSSRASSGAPLGSRMLSILLSGLHRAIPFCDEPATRERTGELLASQLSTLFRCAHASSFGTAVQALMVLSHATRFTPSVADRFHRALYAAVLHPDLPTSGKQALLLNVVYKAMRADTSPGRVAAYAKRLLQSCAHAPPAFTCGVLLLLSEVSVAQVQLRELLAAPALAASAAGPERDGTGSSVKSAAPGATHLDDDDPGARKDQGGDDSVDGAAGGKRASTHAGIYDWQKRDPQYSFADKAPLWELEPLRHHFHPSVVQFAKCVASGEPIVYAGDP